MARRQRPSTSMRDVVRAARGVERGRADIGETIATRADVTPGGTSSVAAAGASRHRAVIDRVGETRAATAARTAAA